MILLLNVDLKASLKGFRRSLSFNAASPRGVTGNESIHDYFVRFHKLVNDMKITRLEIPTHRMNTKFVNNLPSYWAKQPYVKKTLLKLEQSSSLADPLAYVAHTNTTTAKPSPSTPSPQTAAQTPNEAMMATMTQIANLLSGFHKQKAPGNVGNNGARGKKVICFNCRAKEKGPTLDVKAEAFLTNVECTAPYDEPLEMTTTNMFQANHKDAYDSDVDEGPNANVAFMENLTSKDVNEVHSDDNHIFDNVNHQLAQEMHQEEHLGFDDEYDFLANTIPYKKLSLVSDAENVSIKASAANSDQIAMIDILNNLTSQVARHAKTNQEITLENETLKNELVRCKQEIGRLDTQKIKLDLVIRNALLDPTHTPVSVWDSDDVLVHKMELSRKQAYWLNSQDYTPSKPVTPFVRKGPPPSQVLASLHLVKVVFPQFESIIIEHTTKKPLYVSVTCFDYAKEFAEQQLIPFYEHFKK
nr:retrovirus-related Pol polyprotein from transposon TNT 1-94 [Tanacetum cinerariifolium]